MMVGQEPILHYKNTVHNIQECQGKKIRSILLCIILELYTFWISSNCVALLVSFCLMSWTSVISFSNSCFRFSVSSWILAAPFCSVFNITFSFSSKAYLKYNGNYSYEHSHREKAQAPVKKNLGPHTSGLTKNLYITLGEWLSVAEWLGFGLKEINLSFTRVSQHCWEFLIHNFVIFKCFCSPEL